MVAVGLLAGLWWLFTSGVLGRLVAFCQQFALLAGDHWSALALLFVLNALLEASLVLTTLPHVFHIFLPLSFGFVLGPPLIFCLVFTASITCFVSGRFVVRQCVLEGAGHFRLFRACDRALQQDATLVVVLRLSPLSDAFVSYVLALTGAASRRARTGWGARDE